MSEAISALAGANSDAGIAVIAEQGLQGMITLRGNFDDAAFVAAACAAAGVDALPAQRRFAPAPEGGMDGGIAWMSPDEVLILVPYTEVSTRLAALNAALAGQHALAVDVSDARAYFSIQGPHAREVLAKLCPVDLAPESFGINDLRRTRMAQIPAAFWMSDAETLRLICFRSVAEYAYGLLRIAAQSGSAVNYF